MQGSYATIATSLFACIILQLEVVLHIVQCNMFRTTARRLAAASTWPGPQSKAQIEAAQQTAINISKAQGIGQRGFLDGTFTTYLFLPSLPSN